MSLRKLAISIAVFAVISLGSMATANAVPTVFQLTQGNPGLQSCAGCTGPYATVTVNATSATTATITFQGLPQGSNIYLFGASGAIGLNFNGGPVSVQTSTVGTLSTTPTAGNEDGFGSFNFTLDNSDGFTNAFSAVTLTVSCPTCNWNTATSANVLTANANGNLAAAHIFVSCDGCTSARATGFASNGTPSTEVPEPATMLLLGTGLIGLGTGLRRRLRRNRLE